MTTEQFAFRNSVTNLGYAQLFHAMMLDPELSDGAYRTFAAYVKYAQQKNNCYPGIKRIAEDRNKTTTTISRHNKELEKLGYITRERRRDTSTMTYIEDVCQIDRLQKLASTELESRDSPQENGTLQKCNIPILQKCDLNKNKIKNNKEEKQPIIPRKELLPEKPPEAILPSNEKKIPEKVVPFKADPLPQDDPPANNENVKSNSRPLAVDAFRKATHRFPNKTLWDEIDKIVGESSEELTRWHEVCWNYVACGWNPCNVKGMLEHFVQRKTPGEEYGPRAQPLRKSGLGTNPKTGMPEPASAAPLRVWIEKEGLSMEDIWQAGKR